MKNVFIALVLLLFISFGLFADGENDDNSLFPEQIVFRSVFGGGYTVHTALTFLYPFIPETDEGRYIYWYNHYNCHQRFDRSFFIGDYPIAVCARCTGINVGSTIGAAAYIFRDGRGELSKESLIDSLISIGIHGLIMAPMAADGLIQRYTDYESNNIKRVTTGLLYGYGQTVVYDEIAWLVSASIRSIFD